VGKKRLGERVLRAKVKNKKNLLLKARGPLRKRYFMTITHFESREIKKNIS
jgi:hypothetical protein